MSRYLGIDYGDRRVGIAIADAQVPIAFPRETIDRQKTDLWQRLEQLIANERIAQVVVGLPMHPDGRLNGKNIDVEKFAQEFRTRFQLPLHFQDESYSSVTVKERTGHFRRKEKMDKGRVDRAAASLILQAWLDNHISERPS